MTARGLRVEPLARSAGGTVRDAVMAVLTHFDVTTIFGNPGSTELPMFRDLECSMSQTAFSVSIHTSMK